MPLDAYKSVIEHVEAKGDKMMKIRKNNNNVLLMTFCLFHEHLKSKGSFSYEQ